MSDLNEVMDALEEQGATFEKFRKDYNKRMAEVEDFRKDLTNVEKRIRGGLEEFGEKASQLQATQARINLSGNSVTRLPSPHERELAEAVRSAMCGDDRALKGMSTGNDPAGGYFVLPAFSEQMTSVEQEHSPIRAISRVVPIQQADAFEEILDKDIAGASWVAESAARPATATPQVAKLRIPVHEMYAMPEATQSLIDDARFDIVGWLSGKAGQQFGELEGTAFVTGDGLGKPRGFLSYPTAATGDATRAWGTFEHVATGTSGGFGTDPNGADKLIDLVHKLKAGYRRNAVWVMNKRTAGEVRKLKDAAGRFVWVDSLLPNTPPSLLGYPVVEAENMPDIAANSLSIAFGNFRRGYTVVDRSGVRLLVDPFTNKPYVRLYTYKRVGGDVNDFHAIKLLKFA